MLSVLDGHTDLPLQFVISVIGQKCFSSFFLLTALIWLFAIVVLVIYEALQMS